MPDPITLTGTIMTVHDTTLAQDIYLWKLTGRRPKLSSKKLGTATDIGNQVEWDANGMITIKDGPLRTQIYDKTHAGQQLAISVNKAMRDLVKKGECPASLMQPDGNLYTSAWTLRDEGVDDTVTPPAKDNLMCPCDFEP